MAANSCRDADPRHHRSSDGKTEAFYVWADKAIFRHVLLDFDNKTRVRYDLAEAVSGEDPADPSVTGDNIVKVLVEDIEGAGWVNLPSGRCLLVSGFEPFEGDSASFDEVVKYTAERHRRFFLVAPDRVVAGDTLEELNSQSGHDGPGLHGAMLRAAADFFESLKD